MTTLFATSSSAAVGVLVCTDFSSAATVALQRAATQAALMQQPLTVLHVLSADGMMQQMGQWLNWMQPIAQHLIDAAQQWLQQQLTQAAHALTGAEHAPARAALAQCQTHISSGHLIQAIKTQIRQQAPALVVLGARGDNRLSHLLLGTTAERLVGRSLRPLLVVRQAQPQAYRRVLVAVDFSPWTALTLQVLQQLAPQAHWVLLHAWSLPFEDKLSFAGVDDDTVAHYRQHARGQALQWLHQTAHDHGLRDEQWTPCLVHDHPSDAVLRHAKEHDCDLIAIGKHGQDAAEELLLGSVSKHVLAESACDVLVVNAAMTSAAAAASGRVS